MSDVFTVFLNKDNDEIIFFFWGGGGVSLKLSQAWKQSRLSTKL